MISYGEKEKHSRYRIQIVWNIFPHCCKLYPISRSLQNEILIHVQREITQVMHVNSYFISSSLTYCSLQEEVTFTPRLIAVDLKGSLITLKQEGILYETNQQDDIKW